MIKYKESKITAEEFLKTKKEAMDNALGIISNKFKEVFDNNPEFLTIFWTQYTPYFNDGDTCEFSVHDMQTWLSPSMWEDEGIKASDFIADYDWLEETGELEETMDALISNPEDYIESFYEGHLEYRAKTKKGIALQKIISELNDFAKTCQDLFEEAFGNHCSVVATRRGFFVEGYEHD